MEELVRVYALVVLTILYYAMLSSMVARLRKVESTYFRWKYVWLGLLPPVAWWLWNGEQLRTIATVAGATSCWLLAWAWPFVRQALERLYRASPQVRRTVDWLNARPGDRKD